MYFVTIQYDYNNYTCKTFSIFVVSLYFAFPSMLMADDDDDHAVLQQIFSSYKAYRIFVFCLMLFVIITVPSICLFT